MSFVHAVLQSRFGRSWHAEPAIATVAFIVFIAFFRSCERHGSQPDRVPPAKLLTWRGVGTLCAYWAFVAAWVAVVPRPAAADGCPRTGAGLVHLLVETGGGIIAYDFIFFFLQITLTLVVSCLSIFPARLPHDPCGR